MAVVSEDRAVSPGVVSQAGVSVRILALRLSPVLMTLVVEPWTAVAVALDLFRRKPRTETREFLYPHAVGARKTIHRQRHVINGSLSLLGLAALIIGALTITNESARTWSDEVAWIAAAFMLGSIALSVSATRGGVGRSFQMRIADGSFLAGMTAILVSLFAAAWQLPR